MMTVLAVRRLALMTVFATCAVLVALAVALGLDADAGDALVQALPVAAVCAGALTILLSDPFSSR